MKVMIGNQKRYINRYGGENAKNYSLLLIPILFVMLFASLFSGLTAYADKPAPQIDYMINTENGEYVFVMLAVDESYADTDEDIRSLYSYSGLYDVADNQEPVWTINWYAFEVDLSSDGQYLVRRGPWADTHDYSDLALAFYENGELLKSFEVVNLVAEPEKLSHSVSHYMWLDEKQFDHEKMELFVRTINGEEFMFDVTTGDVMKGVLFNDPTEDSKSAEDDNLSITVIVIICVSAALMVAVIGIITWYRFRRTN